LVTGRVSFGESCGGVAVRRWVSVGIRKRPVMGTVLREPGGSGGGGREIVVFVVAGRKIIGA